MDGSLPNSEADPRGVLKGGGLDLGGTEVLKIMEHGKWVGVPRPHIVGWTLQEREFTLKLRKRAAYTKEPDKDET